MTQRRTTVLAISRQFASGGSYIGQAVARRLGLVYVDREILQGAARELDLAEADIEQHEERATSAWERMLAAFALAVPEATYVPPPIGLVYEEDVFRAESKIIREIAARNDAVVVGRAGFSVLAGLPGLVSVAVRADRPFRIRRFMEIYAVTDEATAATRVDASDRRRAEFIKTFTGHDWNDPLLYDLCVDTGKLGLELATELVVTAVAARMRALGQEHPAPTS